MLLSLLSKEEKSHFLDLLNELISADGKPTETELSIKNRLKYEMGDEILKYKKSNLSKEKLIEKCIEHARSKDMRYFRLEVLTSNRQAIAFYEKHRFIKEKDCSENSIYMVLDLKKS